MTTTKYSTLITQCSDYVPSDEEAFAQILNRSLDDLALLQDQLADILEVGPSTLSRWLNGKAVPMKRTRMAIVEDILKRAQRLQADSIRRHQKQSGSEPRQSAA